MKKIIKREPAKVVMPKKKKTHPMATFKSTNGVAIFIIKLNNQYSENAIPNALSYIISAR